MPPVFWLTVLFVLASGLSAYIGNNWGRKLGKRKLSVFTLRPKHTSTFLTILLSMSLSLGLLGSWLLLSPQAREAMLYPPEQARPLAVPVQLAGQPAPDSASQTSAATPTAPVQTAAQAPETVSRPQTATAKTAAPPASPTSWPDRRAAAPLPLSVPTAPATRQSRHVQTSPSPALEPAPVRPAPARPSAPERDARLALAASAASSDQSPAERATAVTPQNQPAAAAPSQTLFALQIYGGLKPAESQQLLQGVLDLTRDYAQLMLASAENAPLLQVQSQELAQSQSRLQQAGVYQLQVSLQTGSDQQRIPVKLQLQALPAAADFDPHELLELARMENPAPSGSSLHQELHLAMQNLAAEQRDAAPSVTGTKTLARAADARPQQSASLPFEIINLRRQGQTLQGQIIMAGSLLNLTEN
ncbi:MAG: DUF3084 domain-containing protein [Candidatus Sericytochromatia bacterium]|nr:DUF3084 domain-containing protein [Candidatus Sericytochromatia bacterium]